MSVNVAERSSTAATAGVFTWQCMTMHVKAVAPLTTDETYTDRAVNVYSSIVLTCFGVYALFFFAMYRTGAESWGWFSGTRRRKNKTVMWTHRSLLRKGGFLVLYLTTGL